MRLEKLGYELETGKHGQPEVKGYTQEYLEASSPRREQIKEYLLEIGRAGAGAAQVAAHRTRDNKEIQPQEEVLRRHRALAAQFGHQADRVVAEARERIHQHQQQPEKTAQQAATYARNHVFERSPFRMSEPFFSRCLIVAWDGSRWRCAPGICAPPRNTPPQRWCAWSEQSSSACRPAIIVTCATQRWYRIRDESGPKTRIRN